ncbi:molybdopterin-dependent oxidoreductase [Petrachloros mirabilis]
MARPSRRRFLKAAGGLLLATALPPPVLAGLLDRVFGQRPGNPLTPITSNENFYVTSYRSPPDIRLDQWSLTIKGLVEQPTTMTYEQLIAMPTVSQIVTLECVGNTVAGEFIGTAEWEGVPLDRLLSSVGIDPGVFDVVFRAADGYSDSIPLQRAMAGDVLIAHKMNGVPLPLGHGFPARAIVPGHYGMKSVQWLTEIELTREDYRGYYAKKGWTEEAVIKTTSWIDRPEHGSMIQGPPYTVRGVAFAGTRGIQSVEISTDGGDRWKPASLEAPLASAAWIFWRYDWTVPNPGRHTLLVRATDGTGALQTSLEQSPAPDGASGLHEITVTVEA